MAQRIAYAKIVPDGAYSTSLAQGAAWVGNEGMPLTARWTFEK
jgi:hypothetical protein